MKTKNIASILLVLAGEALIIFGFINFSKNLQSETLVLNIIISTIILSLFTVDIIFPWINLKDKTQKQIGSIGLRWFFTFLYLFLAVGAMILFNTVCKIHYSHQIYIHCILLFLLMLGLFLAFSSSEKVKTVFIEESQNRQRIDEMKKITKELIVHLNAKSNISDEIINRVTNLHDDLRYISPINTTDAIALENKYVEEVKMLIRYINLEQINTGEITGYIKKCETTYKDRKQLFSN